MNSKVLFALLLLLALAANLGGQSVPTERPFESFRLAVVPNLATGDVSILDTRQHVEVARLPVGTLPSEVAMSGDGRFAYVGTGSGAIGRPFDIVKIDLGSRAVVSTLTINASSPLSELEVSPDGATLAVSELLAGTLYLIDAGPMTLRSTTVLCPSCGINPIVPAASVHFSNDSALLYAAMPVENALRVVATAGGAIVSSLPAPPNSAGSYGDIKVLQPFDQLVFVPHRQRPAVRVYDVTASVFLDLNLSFNSPTDIELIPGTNLLVAGSFQFDPQPDFLEVFDLNTFTSTLVPANEVQGQLTVHPQRDEIWTHCESVGLLCGPTDVIETFDLTTRTRTASIAMPGNSFRNAFPSFSQDGRSYYQPQLNNTVLVVDVASKTIVAQIPVGRAPIGVFMQGDSRPKE